MVAERHQHQGRGQPARPRRQAPASESLYRQEPGASPRRGSNREPGREPEIDSVDAAAPSPRRERNRPATPSSEWENEPAVVRPRSHDSARDGRRVAGGEGRSGERASLRSVEDRARERQRDKGRERDRDRARERDRERDRERARERDRGSETRGRGRPAPEGQKSQAVGPSPEREGPPSAVQRAPVEGIDPARLQAVVREVRDQMRVLVEDREQAFDLRDEALVELARMRRHRRRGVLRWGLLLLLFLGSLAFNIYAFTDPRDRAQFLQIFDGDINSWGSRLMALLDPIGPPSTPETMEGPPRHRPREPQPGSGSPLRMEAPVRAAGFSAEGQAGPSADAADIVVASVTGSGRTSFDAGPEVPIPLPVGAPKLEGPEGELLPVPLAKPDPKPLIKSAAQRGVSLEPEATITEPMTLISVRDTLRAEIGALRQEMDYWRQERAILARQIELLRQRYGALEAGGLPPIPPPFGGSERSLGPRSDASPTPPQTSRALASASAPATGGERQERAEAAAAAAALAPVPAQQQMAARVSEGEAASVKAPVIVPTRRQAPEGEQAAAEGDTQGSSPRTLRFSLNGHSGPIAPKPQAPEPQAPEPQAPERPVPLTPATPASETTASTDSTASGAASGAASEAKGDGPPSVMSGSAARAASAAAQTAVRRSAEEKPRVRSVYISRAGDSLRTISGQFGIPLERLLQVNNYPSSNTGKTLRPGELINIPD